MGETGSGNSGDFGREKYPTTMAVSKLPRVRPVKTGSQFGQACTPKAPKPLLKYKREFFALLYKATVGGFSFASKLTGGERAADGGGGPGAAPRPCRGGPAHAARRARAKRREVEGLRDALRLSAGRLISGEALGMFFGSIFPQVRDAHIP